MDGEKKHRSRDWRPLKVQKEEWVKELERCKKL